MHHIDGNEIDRIFYWFVWTVFLIGSKVAGFFGIVSTGISEVSMPVHTIKYLPQLSEAMPAFIIAGGCAFISAIISKIVGVLWNRLFTKTPVK